MNDLITIGLTCYNAQDTIGRAIDSALTQDYPNFEIVIVDDCSSDNSCAVIEAFAAEREKIRLIKHKVNQGPGAARQTILEAAYGNFIAFFDDDDVAHASRISAQHKRIISYEKAYGVKDIACYVSGTRIYPNGYEMQLKAVGCNDDRAPRGEALADFILFFGRDKRYDYGGTPSCSLMARKSTFERVGGFDPAFRRVEDLDFAVRLALLGGHFIGCPENLFTQYSTHAPDKSGTKNLDAERQLVLKHRSYLEGKKQFYYALNWPKLRHYHFQNRYDMLLITLVKLFCVSPIQVTKHFSESAIKRMLHERKMNKKMG